jgi:hypothetical protein
VKLIPITSSKIAHSNNGYCNRYRFSVVTHAGSVECSATETLIEGRRTRGRRVQNVKRKDFLGTRHSLLSHFFFILPQRLCIVNNIICIYIYIDTHTHI